MHWFFLSVYRPPRGSVAASCGLICAVILWLLSPRAIFSQASIQRDSQALTVLTQAIAVGGGQESLSSVQDFTETGTITYYSAGQISGDVTVKGHGLHQFKIEADLPNGKRTTIVNGAGGLLKEADGRSIPIYGQGAADLGSLTFPYLPLIESMKDQSVSIIYKGLVIHNGISAYDVRFQKVYTKHQDPQGTRGEREARDFYIEAKTLLISAISDQVHFGAGPHDDAVSLETLYSNYQSENGINIPLTIMQTIRGAPGLTITLSQVTFNSGLGESDFTW